MKFVIDKVDNGKPVFILGYGASGSGKTSALIYFNRGDNNTKKNGVVIHICNELAKKGYTTINMKVEEYFIVNEENYIVNKENYEMFDSNDNTVEKPITIKTTNYEFIYKKNEKNENNENNEKNFYLKVDKQDQEIYHSYRYGDNENDPYVKSLSFNETSTMGQIMMELIDKNRFVKATTNNPQSSRSHSMAYLELIHNNNANKKGYIIVGDYAGIENEFTCDNSSTIIDFLEIKRDCIKEKKEQCEEYYKDEVFTTSDNSQHIDPYDKISEIEYIDDFKIPFNQHITDFVKGVEKENLKTIYAILNSNFEKIVDDPNVEKEVDSIADNKKRKLIEDLFYTNVKSDFDGSHQKIKDMAKKINEDLNEIKNYSTSQEYSKDNKNKIIMNINNIKNIKNDEIKLFFRPIRDEIQYTSLINELKKGPFIINDENELTITYDLNNEVFKKNFYLDVLNKTNIEKIFKQIVQNKKIKEIKDIGHIEKMDNTCNQNDESPDKKYPNTDHNYTFIKGFFNKILKNAKEIRNIYVDESGCVNDTKSKGKQELMNGEDPKYPDQKKLWYEGLINHEFFQTKMDELKNLMINRDKNIIKIYNRGNTPINVNYEHLKYWHNKKNEANSTNDLLKTTHFFNGETTINKITMINEVEKKISIVESLVEIFTKLSVIINIGKKICNNRLVEGKFINESLRDMRETIKDIVTVKTKDKIFNSPDYVDFCLSQYCPTHTDCFKYKSNTATDTSKIKSLLIRSIYDYIKKTTKKTEEYTVEEFYKEILISVFCVFNISRSANNPPSIPYIDINELKINVMLYKKNGDNASKDKMLKELVLLYCKLGIVTLNESDKIVEGTTSFAENIKNNKIFKKYIDYFNTNQQTEKSSPEYITTFKNNQINSIITSAEYKIIYKFLKEYKNDEITNITEDTIITIEKFIQIVDGNNAVSAIGTLEFTDQIAKYNTTQTICNTKGLENPGKIGDYKNIRGFNYLYHPTE